MGSCSCIKSGNPQKEIELDPIRIKEISKLYDP